MLRDLIRPARGVPPVRAALVAVLAPALATVFALPFSQGRALSAASLYLLAVVAAAAVGGLVSGLATSVLAFLGLNFFFTPPLHTLRLQRQADVIALAVFLVTTVIVGLLLARALDDQARAARREEETRVLNYLGTRLLSGEPLERVLGDFASTLVDLFGFARLDIRAEVGDRSIAASAGHGDGAATTVVPIVAGNVPFGTVTAAHRPGAPPLGVQEQRLLEACAGQAALALERARLDEQIRGARLEAESSQTRAALFSSVTHDLRTPLASIKASVTSLLDEAVEHDPGQVRELLGTVLEETDRLNRLVGNMLDLSRARAGALVPARQPTAIEDVVASVLARLGTVLRGLRVRTIVRDELPDVSVDPMQIDQVLTNLLENAARYSAPGGEIVVSAAVWHRNVRVRVVDQGAGIPVEDRERVFEPFYRDDRGERRGGAGLGLAIARAIVLAHGGRIWIEGAPGGGTAVAFELPIDAEPGPQPEPEGGSAPHELPRRTAR